MTDSEIVSLYFERDERAIEETRTRYGDLLFGIAYHILYSHEDSEECVADTYVRAWNIIPPQKPVYLSPFLSKITRRISIDRLRYHTAQKRFSEALVSFDELEDVIKDSGKVYERLEAQELSQMINRFLYRQKKDVRRAFVLRYFYCESIKEIALQLRCSKSKIKSMLYHTRQKLIEYLLKEGVSDE